MARIWSFDQAGLAATHAEAGMAEVIDPLLEALATLPLWALAGAVAVVMALEASLLTGLVGPESGHPGGQHGGSGGRLVGELGAS